jgi:hypothetical protein
LIDAKDMRALLDSLDGAKALLIIGADDASDPIAVAAESYGLNLVIVDRGVLGAGMALITSDKAALVFKLADD